MPQPPLIDAPDIPPPSAEFFSAEVLWRALWSELPRRKRARVLQRAVALTDEMERLADANVVRLRVGYLRPVLAMLSQMLVDEVAER